MSQNSENTLVRPPSAQILARKLVSSVCLQNPRRMSKTDMDETLAALAAENEKWSRKVELMTQTQASSRPTGLPIVAARSPTNTRPKPLEKQESIGSYDRPVSALRSPLSAINDSRPKPFMSSGDAKPVAIDKEQLRKQIAAEEDREIVRRRVLSASKARGINPVTESPEIVDPSKASLRKMIAETEEAEFTRRRILSAARSRPAANPSGTIAAVEERSIVRERIPSRVQSAALGRPIVTNNGEVQTQTVVSALMSGLMGGARKPPTNLTTADLAETLAEVERDLAKRKLMG